MSTPLMRNKAAQEAYRLSRPRRRTDNSNCFCGQSGTALIFGVVSGYITLLCSGLRIVTSSLGQDESGDNLDHHQLPHGNHKKMVSKHII